MKNLLISTHKVLSDEKNLSSAGARDYGWQAEIYHVLLLHLAHSAAEARSKEVVISI